MKSVRNLKQEEELSITVSAQSNMTSRCTTQRETATPLRCWTNLMTLTMALANHSPLMPLQIQPSTLKPSNLTILPTTTPHRTQIFATWLAASTKKPSSSPGVLWRKTREIASLKALAHLGHLKVTASTTESTLLLAKLSLLTTATSRRIPTISSKVEVASRCQVLPPLNRAE